MSFSINDPVHVTVSGKKLEGVIAYLEDQPQRVGIRLTGSSVGQGDHDGQGKFVAPPKSGVWVTDRTHIVVRKLTRLEELRLKRELETGGGGSSGATRASRTTASSRIPSTRTPPRSSGNGSTTSGSSTTSAAAAATATSGTARSKLEEIRARRQAAQQERNARTPPVSSTASSSTPTNTRTGRSTSSTPPRTSASTSTTTDDKDAREQQEALQQQLTQVQQERDQYQQQVETLQQSLTKVQGEHTAAQSQVQALQQELQTAQQELQAAPKPPTPSKTLSTSQEAVSEQVQEEINALHRAKSEAIDQYETTKQRLVKVEAELRIAQEQQTTDRDEVIQLRTQVRTLQQQLTEATTAAAAAAAASSTATSTEEYKEKAKRQALEAAHQRAAQAWQEEKIQLEGSIEELVLDKEQLVEENQSLFDKLEEMKLDLETAQMETEEVRLEMEDVRAAAAAAPTSPTASGGGEDDEKMQVLSYQNARLREALIRLREQSSLEKMALQKELRQAESEAQLAQDLSVQVTELKQIKGLMEEETNDLKDMVEQGAAFEGMVEDLSDRVMSMEEDMNALQTTIREMEEAAELSAEVEEMQTEEIKALLRDLESREAVVGNLEEAIKMQRRREEDFRRTVGNYRTTVETLKQEKEALLQVQQGAYGEKSEMMATSQKALARAAQLVTDAANLRKEKAQAAAKAMDHIVYKHLSGRLESLVPSSVVAAEVGAMKGELYACKVAGKASQSLEGIVESLTKHIQPALPPDESATVPETPTLDLSDDARQEVTTMLHQVEMAHVLVTASSELRRFVIGGQWPDLVAPDVSIEVGAILGHAVGELDSMLGGVFRSLKEEGALTPEQSNLGALRQMVATTVQRITAEVDREDATLIDKTWNPPGWDLLRKATTAKFSCLGAAASVSIVQADKENNAVALNKLYNRVEQAASQSSNICFRLSNLDVNNPGLVESIGADVEKWMKTSAGLSESVRAFFLSSEASLDACSQCVDEVLKDMAKLLLALRSAKLNPVEDGSFHALSPEGQDPWERISTLVRSVRSIDGDHEDVNHLIRARDIERQLEQAIENEPKLEKAETKVAQLEKTLLSRSKEIAMQNARLSELEKVVAKSSGSIGRVRSSEVKSAEEYNSLREENRVLSEAMDVLQRQVDEYENEIRVLKDFKSPKRGGAASRGTPRRSMTSVGDFGSPQGRLMADEKQTSTGVLEATLFRPALQKALEESARWKSTAAAAALLDLPPLPMLSAEESKIADDRSDNLHILNDALGDFRLELASIKVVDLTRKDKTPREQLRENNARSAAAANKLTTVFQRCRGKAMM